MKGLRYWLYCRLFGHCSDHACLTKSSYCRCGRSTWHWEDELVCLTHGRKDCRLFGHCSKVEHTRQAPPRDPVVPWTEDERELWRRADAGEVFDLAQDHDEEEPMTGGDGGTP